MTAIDIPSARPGAINPRKFNREHPGLEFQIAPMFGGPVTKELAQASAEPTETIFGDDAATARTHSREQFDISREEDVCASSRYRD